MKNLALSFADTNLFLSSFSFFHYSSLPSALTHLPPPPLSTVHKRKAAVVEAGRLDKLTHLANNFPSESASPRKYTSVITHRGQKKAFPGPWSARHPEGPPAARFHRVENLWPLHLSRRDGAYNGVSRNQPPH